MRRGYNHNRLEELEDGFGYSIGFLVVVGLISGYFLGLLVSSGLGVLQKLVLEILVLVASYLVLLWYGRYLARRFEEIKRRIIEEYNRGDRDE